MAVLNCLKGKCPIPERTKFKLKVARVGYVRGMWLRLSSAIRCIPMAPPGHEGVGYVAKIGAGVTDFKEGDRVAGGGFANVRNLSAQRVFKIPESDLPDEYWIVEPVSCAVTGIDHCQIQPGNRIVLVGCGFMGLLILQGLLRYPLDDLIVLDIVQSRLDLAQQLGVGEVYNTAGADLQELSRELKSREIDVVVDTSGSQAGSGSIYRYCETRRAHQSLWLAQRADRLF